MKFAFKSTLHLDYIEYEGLHFQKLKCWQKFRVWFCFLKGDLSQKMALS